MRPAVPAFAERVDVCRFLSRDDDENMAMALNEGDPAPELDLPTDGGGRFRLSEKRGFPVLLYFYPKDDTEGCTKEAIGFSERKSDFDEMQTLIVGVSPDSPRSHETFKTKHGLSILLASDEEKRAAEAYGVWIEKSMYGRQFMGVDRATFLIDRDGVIARIWRNVKGPGPVEDGLDATA